MECIESFSISQVIEVSRWIVRSWSLTFFRIENSNSVLFGISNFQIRHTRYLFSEVVSDVLVKYIFFNKNANRLILWPQITVELNEEKK